MGKNNYMFPIFLILAVELCERLCFYTLNGSQKVFMQGILNKTSDDKQSAQATATSLMLTFVTVCYITCVLGGVVADRWLGKFKTIGLFSAMYVIGMFLCAAAALPMLGPHTQNGIFMTGLFAFVAFGTGGIKPNVSNFGADQLPPVSDTFTMEQRDSAESSYFQWFYMVVNIGSLIAFAVMTTIATEGLGAIPARWGFFSAYGIAAVLLFLCLGSMMAAFPIYNITDKPSKSIIRPTAMTIVRSARRGETRAVMSIAGFVCFVLSFAFLVGTIATPSEVMMGSVKATVVMSTVTAVLALLFTVFIGIAHSGHQRFLRESDVPASTEDPVDLADPEGLVEDADSGTLDLSTVRRTLGCFPVLLAVNMAFNTAYAQMTASFVNSACQMDLRLVSTTPVNGSFFNIADCIAIMVFVPVMEVVFKRMDKKGWHVTRNAKLLVGMGFGVIALLVAAMLEVARRSAPLESALAFPPNMSDDAKSNCAGSDDHAVYMSTMPAAWMFLPYALIGLGEILVNPVLYHASFALAPTKTVGLVQSFNLLAQGCLPNMLAAAFSTGLPAFQPVNLNYVGVVGIEIFYYVSIVVLVLGAAFYGWIHSQSVEEEKGEPPMEDLTKSFFSEMGETRHRLPSGL